MQNKQDQRLQGPTCRRFAIASEDRRGADESTDMRGGQAASSEVRPDGLLSRDPWPADSSDPKSGRWLLSRL